MKKILSLLLCLALLAGLFAVSAFADDTPADTPRAEGDFTAAVAPQAFAATMASWLSDQEGAEALADPLFLWDAAGWYAAWLYRTEGCDLLSPEAVDDFLHSLGAEACPLPESWAEYGVVRVLRTQDGGTYYDFEQHKTEIDAMLGVDTMVSFIEETGNSLTAVLSCFYEDDLSAEWLYTVDFEKADAEAAFPYRLTGLCLLENGPQLDESIDFSWAELLDANRLENVLKHYPAVRISAETGLEGDDRNGTWLLDSGGALAQVSYGESYVGGQFRDCFFEYETCEDGAERAVVGHIATEEDAVDLNNYLTDYLSGVVIVQLEQEEDDIIWLACTFRGGYRERIAVDRGTLVLRAIDYSSGDMVPPSEIRFDYMKPAPVYPFLESWKGAMRTVSLVWESFEFDEESGEWERAVRTEEVSLPGDWEYLPYEARWGEYTAYTNPDYIGPYAYPGDGVDYTLYLTTAKG
ncbi:MAG: hypothetical protein IKO83_09700 [Oscillospiraceae bacterium]|nr:hypothetical protein [Oscillospiraceae bacterium]